MQPRTLSDLLKVDTKDRAVYRQFSLALLTSYSVHWLNQWQLATTYENVSVLNARLFPHDFTMAGFPELPDALRTNRSLLQMRPKWRGYATSDPRKGVHLTEKGKNEVARVIDVIGVPTFNGRSVHVGPADVDPRTEHREKKRTYDPHDTVKKIRTGILFRRYRDQRNDETGVVHLLGLLELYDHTPPSEMR